MKKLKKYQAIFLARLKSTLSYRGELILWSFIDGLPLFGNLILWSVAYDNTDTISGLTKTALISYYLIGYLFQDLTGSHFEEHYIKDVLSGNFNALLLKPFSVKKMLVVEEMAWRVMTIFFSQIPIIMLGIFLGVQFAQALSIPTVLSIIAVLIMAFFMEAIYSLTIVAMSFIMEEARSLMHLKWMIQWLFSGSMIPFEFMPDWLHNLAKWLPFQARYYLPSSLYLQTISPQEIVRSMFVIVGWAIILYLWIKWFWRHNLQKFTAVGS